MKNLRNWAFLGYNSVALLFERVAMLVVVAVPLYKVLMTKSDSIEILDRTPSVNIFKKTNLKIFKNLVRIYFKCIQKISEKYVITHICNVLGFGGFFLLVYLHQVKGILLCSVSMEITKCGKKNLGNLLRIR